MQRIKSSSRDDPRTTRSFSNRIPCKVEEKMLLQNQCTAEAIQSYASREKEISNLFRTLIREPRTRNVPSSCDAVELTHQQ
mmetsp:Transcript_54988/g.87117  ORF Transcript_54988/g.87117 Transcript_54988/m.87117 type:complete len:81 (+) Transcript_54988:40-282(+)